MQTNVGKIDRLIRYAVALILVVLYASGVVAGTLGWVVLVGGIALAATATVRFCGLYTLIGVNTCPLKDRP
ncbi:MAG: DUF2892 domain-containing protein [Bernardetiaceae bacterium]